MYICNVIAAESGIGDGEGHFTGDEIFNRSEIARRLQFAYGSNIPSSAIPELVRILYTGHIDRKDALEGIAEQNLRWKRERANCKEDWRKDYLSKLIQEKIQKDKHSCRYWKKLRKNTKSMRKFTSDSG